MKKTVGVLSLIVMLLSQVFTPFTYAVSGEEVPMPEPVVEEQDVDPVEEVASELAEEVQQPETEVVEGVPVQEPGDTVDEGIEGDNNIVVEPEVQTGVQSGIETEISSGDIEQLTGGEKNLEEGISDKAGTGKESGFIETIKNFFGIGENKIEENFESREIYGTGEYEGVKVEVYAQTGLFASGTELTIEPVIEDKLETVQEVLLSGEVDLEEEQVIAFDITFRDPVTQEELQPKDGTVQVKFNYEDNESLVQAEENEEQEVKVYHLNDIDEEGNKIEELTGTTVEEVVVNEEESEEENVLVIEAESFSVYTIVKQVKDGGPGASEDQLANFVYGSISIEDPDHPGQGITIMDRNLGAREAGTGKSSYGYYYQWGNNYGFDYDPQNEIIRNGTLGTSANAAVKYDSKYNNNGYYGNIFMPYQGGNSDYWENNKYYDNLWGGGSDTYQYDNGNDRSLRQGPCPTGWHVPSIVEMQNLMRYWDKSKNTGPKGSVSNDTFKIDYSVQNNFLDYFKIPSAGYMQPNAGGIWYGTMPTYWLSSRYVANYKYISSFNGYFVSVESRCWGLSVRCFKNVYTPEQYKVTFHFNCTKGIVAEQSVGQDGKVKEPSDPGLTGVVVKWYNNPDLSGDVFDFNNTITSDKDLYAKYECTDESLCKRTVTFETNGGSEVEPVQIMAGLSIDAPENPTNEGFAFIGWYEDEELTNKFDFSRGIAEDIVLYAKRGHTISFDTDGGSEKFPITIPSHTSMYNTKYSHTPNIDDSGNKNGDYPMSFSLNDVVTIDGAEKIKVKITYGSPYDYYYYATMWEGSHPEYTAQNNYSSSITSRLGGGSYRDDENTKNYEIVGNTVTFGFYGGNSSYYYNQGGNYGYYAIIYDVNPNFTFGENPVKEGKVFDGWYKENGEKWNEYNDVLESNITLKAHWKDPEAILLPGKEFNCKLKNLANGWSSSSCYGSTDYLVKNIVRADSIPSGVEKIEIQSDDSSYPIYARKNKGTIYIYSESDIIYMNPSSSYMFYYMQGLNAIDEDIFDTSKVVDMKYMFGYTYGLGELDLSSWNVGNLTSTKYMFYNANSLKKLDLSNWNTTNLEDTSYMFYYSKGLINLNLSGWNITKVTTMYYMFYECNAIETLNLNGWDFSNHPNVQYMFNSMTSLKTLLLRDWVFPETTQWGGGYQGGFYSQFGLSSSYSLKTIDVTNWDLSKTVNLSYLFYDLYSLQEIIGLNTWDTSNIENMYMLFAYCYNLENLDISTWNVSKVTNMYELFYYCKNLEELDLSSWDTSNVTLMSYMFEYCDSLKKLNLDNWNFSKVGNSYSSMFYGTPSLIELGMKNWKFGENITNFACNMGLGCSWGSHNYNKIKGIDVSGWTFSGNSLWGLFYDWESLKSIKGLETWDTSNIVDMGKMFYNVTGLVELDLSSFDTNNVTHMVGMFWNADSLRTVYVSNKFTTVSLLSGDDMFSGATSIVGGNGTVYDINKYNQEYARIDGVGGQSGYFTSVLDKPYMITYNLYDGIFSGVVMDVYTQKDSFAIFDPIKTGYTFIGWTGSNGDSLETGLLIMAGNYSGDLEFNANWRVNQYNILFDTDGGNEIDPILVDFGTSVLNLPTPVKQCNRFVRRENIPITMPAQDITLKAIRSYSCNNSGNTGGGGGGSSNNKKVIDNQLTEKEHKAAEEKQEQKQKEEQSEKQETKQDETVKEEIKAPEKTNTIPNQSSTQNSSSSSKESTVTVDPEIQSAYEWACAHDVTTIPSLGEASPDGVVKRGHLAKMVVNYATNVLGQEIPEKIPSECRWNDWRGDWESEEIKDYAVKSCALGLMGLDMPKFLPNMQVTRAQFGTIMSRLLWGKRYAGGTPYYRKHLNALKENNIMTQIDNPERRVELRQWVWLMLMRSTQNK